MGVFSTKKSKKSSSSSDSNSTMPPPPPNAFLLPYTKSVRNDGENYDLTFPSSGGWQYKSGTSEWVVKSEVILSISYASVENSASTLTKTWNSEEIEKVEELGEQDIHGIGKVSWVGFLEITLKAVMEGWRTD